MTIRTDLIVGQHGITAKKMKQNRTVSWVHQRLLDVLVITANALFALKMEISTRIADIVKFIASTLNAVKYQ